MIITKASINISWLFLSVTIVTISAKLFGLDSLENISKPLLMPLLMIITYNNSKALSSNFPKLIFAALLFSMFGDVFLMPYFDNFILGLASFLIAHVFYIVAFLRKNTSFIEGLYKSKVYVSVIFLSYIFLVAFLVNSMLITDTETFLILAVSFYASIITVMVLSSISLDKVIQNKSSKLIMLGAILFMLSDSIIAINKFSFEVNLSGLWIMSSYTFGQWLITIGSASLNKE